MFPKSYFAINYYAPLYWPPVDDSGPIIPIAYFPYPIYRRARR